jgi:hypothetical protein
MFHTLRAQSHFLFVDAGVEAEGEFGKEIALRTAVEDELCRDEHVARLSSRDEHKLDKRSKTVTRSLWPHASTACRIVPSPSRPQHSCAVLPCPNSQLSSLRVVNRR